MKRDWDVIREILQKTEELEPNKMLELEDFKDKDAYLVSYQVRILLEASLIDAVLSEVMGNEPKNFFIIRLTWEGHEFLDSIRNDSIWMKTKSKILEKGGSMTFDVVNAVALNFIKNAISL